MIVWIFLHFAEFAYNNLVHSSTRYTALFANIGYHPRWTMIEHLEISKNPTTKDPCVNSKKFRFHFLNISRPLNPHTKRSQIVTVLTLYQRNQSFKLGIMYGYYDVMWRPLNLVICWIINEWSIYYLQSYYWSCIPSRSASTNASTFSISCLIVGTLHW